MNRRHNRKREKIRLYRLHVLGIDNSFSGVLEALKHYYTKDIVSTLNQQSHLYELLRRR